MSTLENVVVAQPTETPEDQEIPLPGGFYQRWRCYSCRQMNSVHEVTAKDDGIYLNFLCDCGYDYGIVHTDGKIAAYHTFMKTLEEQKDIQC